MPKSSLVDKKDTDTGEKTPQGDAGAGQEGEQEGSGDEHDVEWWKAQARKHERNARANKAKADANAEAAAELQKLKDADLTDVEKAKKRADELEKELSAYKAKDEVAGWVREVSKATGVPEAALHGSTLEEVEACAESLKEFFPSKTGAPVVNTGKPSSDETAQTAREQFAEAVEQFI